MKLPFFVIMLLGLFPFGLHGAQNAILYKNDIPVSDAVAQFNAITSVDSVGKTQPPLTKDEVLAAIRGWVPEEHYPGNDSVLQRFKKIAETGIIPAGCTMAFISRWSGYNGYDYRVWWIDLFVRPENPEANTLGYNYRLRAQMISSQPHDPQR